MTLIVGHELAIGYIAEAAAGANTPGLSEMRIANAAPYFFRRDGATECGREARRALVAAAA